MNRDVMSMFEVVMRLKCNLVKESSMILNKLILKQTNKYIHIHTNKEFLSHIRFSPHQMNLKLGFVFQH